MTNTEDQRMMWLTEAIELIEAWRKERPDVSLSSVMSTSSLVDRIATALQGAHDRGKQSRS